MTSLFWGEFNLFQAWLKLYGSPTFNSRDFVSSSHRMYLCVFHNSWHNLLKIHNSWHNSLKILDTVHSKFTIIGTIHSKFLAQFTQNSQFLAQFTQNSQFLVQFTQNSQLLAQFTQNSWHNSLKILNNIFLCSLGKLHFLEGGSRTLEKKFR